MNKTSISIVEDESIVALDLKNILEELGYNVPFLAASGEAALKKAEETKPDLILMDIVLKGALDGIETAQQIKSRFQIPVVYLTAYTDDKILKRAKVTEPLGYIIKPFKENEIRVVAELAYYKHKKDLEEKRLSDLYRNTFDSLPDFIHWQDKDFTITRVNKAFAGTIKMKPEDIIGKKCYEILHRSSKPSPGCPFTKTINDRKSHTQVMADSDTGLTLLVMTAPVFDDKGELTGLVHISRDITAIKISEKEIEEKIHELEVFQKAAVHRELKMIELKERIKELEKKAKGIRNGMTDGKK